MHFKALIVTSVLLVMNSGISLGQGAGLDLGQGGRMFLPVLESLQGSLLKIDVMQKALEGLIEKHGSTPATDAALSQVREAREDLLQTMQQLSDAQKTLISSGDAKDTSSTKARDEALARILAQQQAALNEQQKAAEAKITQSQAGQQPNSPDLAAAQAEMSRLAKMQETISQLIKRMHDTEMGAIKNLRGSISGAFDDDMSGVKVSNSPKADQAAKEMGAEAQAQGQDVSLQKENAGKETTAHEAAHVLQFKGPPGGDVLPVTGGQPTTPSLPAPNGDEDPSTTPPAGGKLDKLR